MNNLSQVGVIYKDEQKIGTGFLIDPEHHLLVTARHVIAQFQPDLYGVLEGFSFEFFGISHPRLAIQSQLAGKPREQEDVILLELSGELPRGIQPPALISYVVPTQDVWVTGYTNDKNLERTYKSAQGKLSGYTTRNGVQVYEIDIDGIYAGMSGAPVMLADKGIVGILTHQISEHANQTAQVTPIELVASLDERIATPRKVYLRNLLEDLDRSGAFLERPEYVPPPVSVAASPEATERQFFEDIFQILERYPKFNLVGEAGSGKTTTLQQMAVRAAKRALEDPAAPLPIWVNLSSWSVNSQQYFDNFLEHYLNQAPYKSIKDFYPLEYLIANKKVIFFLDELDEIVGAGPIKDLRNWISQNDLNLYLGCRDSYFSKSRQFELPTVYLEPLNTLDVFRFAQVFLGEDRLADEFVSLIAPNGYIERQAAASDVSQLAANPFLLTLMLQDYQASNRWRSGQEGITIPTLWSLFEKIMISLWELPRVQDQLHETHLLELQFSEAGVILQKLSALAFKYYQQVSISKEVMSGVFPEKILEVLIDSRIIRFNPYSQTYRFMHSLFADFLAGYQIDLHEINQYIHSQTWSSALFILATRGEAERKMIQTALLEVVTERQGDKTRYSLSGITRLLGDFGNEAVIDQLLEIYQKHSVHVELLKPLGKIANRLPDNNEYRIKVMALLEEVMLSPRWMTDPEENGFYELDWFWGDYITATEAMTCIKSPQALDAILAVMEKTARFFEDKLAGGGLMRQEWFSRYLSSMGNWAIPRLLEVLDSDHPHVTVTVAKALLQINRPLEISTIGKLALTHPNPMVRAQLALVLGKTRNVAALSYLEQMLDDLDFWSFGGIAVRWQHTIVADYAAESLAYLGRPEALQALEQHQYTADGFPSPQLLLERIQCGITINHRDRLARQLAGNLLDRQRYDLLLPLLGQVDNYKVAEYASLCPIAEAIIDYCEEAQRQETPTSQARGTSTAKIIGTLVDHLELTSELANQRWCLVILGQIGDRRVLPVLQKYLAGENLPLLMDAAAYGLGKLISRNPSMLIQDIQLLNTLLSAISRLQPMGYLGLGLGLAQITKTCLQPERLHPEVIEMIRAAVLKSFNLDNIITTKSALDLLETISLENPDFITAEVASIIELSPTYHLKMADKLYSNDDFTGTHPYFRERVDYQEALVHYKKALEAHRVKQAPWKYSFTDSDWEELGFHRGHLFYQIGKIQIVRENFPAAYEVFLQAARSLENAPQTVYNRFLMAYAYSELGNLLSRFLDQPNEAVSYFELALSTFRHLPPPEMRNTELLAVFCHAMVNYHNSLIQKQAHARIIEIGQAVKELLSEVQYLPNDDLATIFMNVTVSLAMSSQFEAGLEYAELAQTRLRKSANWELKMASLLKIAEFKHAVTPDDNVEAYILEAKAIANRHGDKLKEAFCWRDLAHNLNSDQDLEQAIFYYEQALSLFGDQEHEKIIEEKVGIYHELAVLYQKLDNFERAEELFITAIELVGQITPSFIHMPYVIQAEYAKLLSITGRHKQAVELLVALGQEMMESGLNPGVVGEILQEIDTPAGHQMPRSAAERLANAAVQVASGQIDRDDYETTLLTIFEQVKSQGLLAERDFIAALLDILNHRENTTLSDENPYFEYYQSAKEQFSEPDTDDYLGVNLSEIEAYLREGNYENAGILYFALAQNLASTDDLDGALDTARLALDCFQKSGPQELIGGTFGFIYQIQMQKKALYIDRLTESIRNSEHEGNFSLVNQQRFELAKALADQGDYAAAISQAQEVRAYYETLGNLGAAQSALTLIVTIQATRDVRACSPDEIDAKIKQYVLDNHLLQAGMLRLTFASSLANNAEYQAARKYTDAAYRDFDLIGYSEGQWMAQQYLEKIKKLTE